MATQWDIEKQAARPMEWFKHDADAVLDDKIGMLLDECGAAGYGRWWRLCEMLARTTGHRLNVSTERACKVAARSLWFDGTDELMDFLRLLDEVGLVHMPGDGTVYSDRMLANATTFGTNRANGKLGGRPRKTPVKTDH